MQTQTIGADNISAGRWGGTRNSDPFSYGLGAFYNDDVDPTETRRLRDKGRKRVSSNPKVNINLDKVYRLAEYMYKKGDIDMRTAYQLIKLPSSVIKMLMTYDSYLFYGIRWVVYESDNGRRIGLVNKFGQTPKEVRNG